jgi:hypothetical protein
MKRVEELLREEFRRSRGVVPPTPDAMLARVTRVRRRRAAAVTGAAFAVVGIVAAVAVITGVRGLPGTQAGQAFPQRLYTSQLINVVFTDHQHGYAVQERCSMDNLDEPVPNGAPTPDIHQQCDSHLTVTTDGGHSWHERDLPADPATKDAGYDLVLGHSLMLWRPEPGTLALGSWGRRYWTTTDGAGTWHESTTPREVGPAGSLAWFGPHDELTFLATTPPAGFAADGSKVRVGPKNPLTPAIDGSFWLACEKDLCVQVTRDGGRHWQIAAPLASATSIDWVTTYDGVTVYAALQTGSGPALARTTDGGATWTEVIGLSGLPERGIDGLAVANGDLIMTRAGADGGTFRLRAGATTVERLTTAPDHANVLYQTGGVIVGGPAWQQLEGPDLSSVASVSADGGTTWFPLPAPPG